MPGADAELRALTSFGAAVGLHRNRTVLEVRPSPNAPAMARLSKVGPLRKRAAYELFAGPGLTAVVGTLSESGGLDGTGTPFGIVNLTGGKVADADVHPLHGGLRTTTVADPTRWRVVQPGLPPLTGHAVDRVAKLNFNRVSGAMDRIGFGFRLDYAGLMTFRFAAPDCAGFNVAVVSRAARLDVTVHDPRVDNRLVLACLAALTLKVLQTARGEAVDLLS
ncbi:hypothetical protein [Actinacidiphila acididurans]|uniref:Uncharacterized protein n=1 Tax=Actinacidiphila acididurans TaxID=2784346 RepID=A0ABS2TNC4_9ACTN|nr:hypothetical protein [Actinacidiphila acididurans]MBM9503951.1 hypothetical protein [Actinacidiphila acididurans]